MRVLRPVLGCLAVTAMIIGTLAIFVGGIGTIIGLVDGPRLARAHVCRAGEHKNCLLGRQGRVLSVNRDNEVVVQYADGLENRELWLRGDAHPPVRSFVRIEFWGENDVAITDRHGRRYTDRLAWPDKWDHFSLAFMGVGSALIVVPIAVSLLVEWIRRSRRQ